MQTDKSGSPASKGAMLTESETFYSGVLHVGGTYTMIPGRSRNTELLRRHCGSNIPNLCTRERARLARYYAIQICYLARVEFSRNKLYNTVFLIIFFISFDIEAVLYEIFHKIVTNLLNFRVGIEPQERLAPLKY